MDLYEHQGKDLFEAHGIPLPERAVATTPDEAAAAAERLGGRVAVKVQVQLGGRGKGGGIALVHSAADAAEAARGMFERGFKDLPVTRVLVERLVDIAAQYYAAISLDRSAGTYLAMVSNEGGVDIEEVARTRPEAIRRLHLDPFGGLRAYHARRLVGHLPPEARTGAADLLAADGGPPTQLGRASGPPLCFAEEVDYAAVSTTLRPGDSVADALELMARYRISGVPITDDEGVLVGTVTEAALMHHVHAHHGDPSALDRPVRDVMAENLPQVPPETDLEAVEALLDVFPAVLVSANGRIQGIVTHADVLRATADEHGPPTPHLKSDGTRNGGAHPHGPL